MSRKNSTQGEGKWARNNTNVRNECANTYRYSEFTPFPAGALFHVRHPSIASPTTTISLSSANRDKRVIVAAPKTKIHLSMF